MPTTTWMVTYTYTVSQRDLWGEIEVIALTLNAAEKAAEVLLNKLGVQYRIRGINELEG